MVSYFRDLLRLGLPADGLPKPAGLAEQGLSFGLRRQRLDLFGDGRGELVLLGVFRGARDLPLRYRAGIVDRDVVEQAPCRLHVARLRLGGAEDEHQHDQGSDAERPGTHSHKEPII
ncbi:hypothetical protein ACVOMS_25225 [Bradyrhizobium guangxiense]